MSKIKAYLDAHPNVRSGLRVFVYAFVATFSLSLLGFLGDVSKWATDDGASFPSVAPLGKAAAAAVASALAGFIGYFYNKLPGTKTAQYTPPEEG
jgi:hypothetical protein